MRELLEAAETDYFAIKQLWNTVGDERGVRIVMYHMQQAIEKLLKCLILLSGKHFDYTHDIGSLLASCPKELEIPEELYVLADSLTSWEAQTRYGSSMLTNIKTLEKCLTIYDTLHALVLSYAEDTSDTAYTIERFVMDTETCEAVKAIHGTEYVLWFYKNFPNGTKSAKEVLDKLNEE